MEPPDVMSKETESSRLIAQINDHFIDAVGPIGELLIDDVKALWRQKGWRGPSAVRHYINALARNIDQEPMRKRFLERTSQLIFNARSKR